MAVGRASRRQQALTDNILSLRSKARVDARATIRNRLHRLAYRSNHWGMSYSSRDCDFNAKSPSAFDTAIAVLQDVMAGKASGKRSNRSSCLDDQHAEVYRLIHQTVVSGESNSMIITGPRGSGKKTIVEEVIRSISEQNNEEFYVVRLNGFLHTDDKLALRDIWQQLGRDGAIDDGVPARNYADSLASLLALLLHSSESGHISNSVIFILEEFDLFASHPRQTLLYNLFDIAQSQAAPIAVIGLTTRVDIADSLEKRVKSRFSHRYAHVDLAPNFAIFKAICKSCLTIPRPERELEDQEQDVLCHVRVSSSRLKGSTSNESSPSVVEAWNDLVEYLFTNDEFVRNCVSPVYKRTKSVPSVLRSFLPIISSIPRYGLSAKSFHRYATLAKAPEQSKLSILRELSDLELALLIAAARLDVIMYSDTCNFRMAYAEYVSLASRARVQSAAGGAAAAGASTKIWAKEIALDEWFRLMERDLLIPVGSSGSLHGVELEMFKADVTIEEIVLSVPNLDRQLEKWCKRI